MNQIESSSALAAPTNGAMSLLDYFAGVALAGLAQAYAGELDGRASEIAHEAYSLAEAMLKARAVR